MHRAVRKSLAVKRHDTLAILVLSVLLMTLPAGVRAYETGTLHRHADGHQLASSPPVLAVAAGGGITRGEVLETMDGGGYTYVRVKTADGDVWAAGPQVSVKVGDTATFSGGMPMVNFHSKGLDRNFEKIFFVSAIRVGDAPASASVRPGKSGPHGAITSSPSSSIDPSGIPKAEGGVTVGTVFAQKSTLAGKEVVIRAKVVKSNTGIMGKNWLHLRDGTAGPDGEDDLTVTTSGTARVGEIIVVRGKVATDKDFGFGYRYDVILEDATVTVEGPST